MPPKRSRIKGGAFHIERLNDWSVGTQSLQASEQRPDTGHPERSAVHVSGLLLHLMTRPLVCFKVLVQILGKKDIRWAGSGRA